MHRQGPGQCVTMTTPQPGDSIQAGLSSPQDSIQAGFSLRICQPGLQPACCGCQRRDVSRDKFWSLHSPHGRGLGCIFPSTQEICHHTSQGQFQ